MIADAAGVPSWHRAMSWTIWAFVLVGLVSYLEWPLHGDASSHLGALHQAITSNRGLSEAWTFRGPSYNTYLFLLHRMASVFVPFSDVVRFDATLKVIHVLVVAACSIGAATGLSKSVRSLNGLATPLSGLLLLAYLSSTWAFWLHAEDVGFVLLLASIAFGTRRPAWALVLAGALASVLPMLKVVTAVLCIPAFAVILIDRQNARRTAGLFAAGFIASAAVQAYAFSTIWTLPIQDLLEAALFQGSAVATWSQRLLRLRLEWPHFLEGTAVFGPALCALPAVLTEAIVGRRFREAVALAAAWLCPVLMALSQDKYFPYHFGCSAFAAAWTVTRALSTTRWSTAAAVVSMASLLVLIEETDHPYFFDHPVSRVALLGCSAVISLATWAARLPHSLGMRHRALSFSMEPPSALVAIASLVTIVSCWFPSDHGLSFAEGKTRSGNIARRVSAIRAAEERFGLSGTTVLTLTYGASSRLLDVKSACRHSFPIPFQRFRIEDRASFETAAGFTENRDCIQSYQGKHVVLEERWMRRSDLYLEMRRSLAKDYRQVGWLGQRKDLALWERRPVIKKKKGKGKKNGKGKGKDRGRLKSKAKKGTRSHSGKAAVWPPTAKVPPLARPAASG